MDTNYLEKLEYNKILKILSNFCLTYIGKNSSQNLLPSNNKNEVEKMLKETNEATSILYKAGTPPLTEISDITIYLKLLESDGVLTAKALLDLAKIFKLSDELKQYFNQNYINENDYPILNNYFSNLYTNEALYKNIYKCILDENTLSDDASNVLKSIRKKQRKTEQNIKSSLNNILHSSSLSKYLQENVVTIRNDRYVLPVKEEYRSQIKGFVHDISSTGSTVFIEPISIFELNNELNNLKIEEKIEIEKILKDLSLSLVPYTQNFKTDVETIGIIDFVFAKAKYSKKIYGITPIINDAKQIKLKNARHPLIPENDVVPINLEIGTNYSSLIITGPNTGGKTVTLKTVGLITLMACSGLNIPADENSSVFVFDNIFADIGDDQSIANSLSTFSSHMVNIVDIINTSTSNSLILVDELGSGTDPIEGAYLAISILEYFYKKNCLTIATTHYQELKKYAISNVGFENASVDFDVSTLTPTYKLLIGVPGKSNAFEISKKLGLNTQIIDNAKSHLNSEDIQFEELLKNIYDEKKEIEKEKLQISEELEKITKLRISLEKEDKTKKQKADELINKAKIEARNILLDAKEEANEAIKNINNISSTKDLNNLRNDLNNKIKNTLTYNNLEPSNVIPIDASIIKPGLKVFVSTLNQDGVVLSNISKSNEVQVQVGNLKMNVNVKYLEKAKTSITNKNTVSSFNSFSKSKNINSEINVIGETVADAVLLVDKFLDDCSLAKLNTVRIIHGKGTGKLKNGIHNFLKTNPHVKSFRMGTFGEGEMGVTVVELK